MQAWLQAMQARMSSSFARFRLSRHVGVADHRPRHADKIGRSAGEDLLGILRLIDAACDEAPAFTLGFQPPRQRAPHSRSAIAMGGTIWTAPPKRR